MVSPLTLEHMAENLVIFLLILWFVVGAL